MVGLNDNENKIYGIKPSSYANVPTALFFQKSKMFLDRRACGALRYRAALGSACALSATELYLEASSALYATGCTRSVCGTLCYRAALFCATIGSFEKSMYYFLGSPSE
jgi:hypothetical protein